MKTITSINSRQVKRVVAKTTITLFVIGLIILIVLTLPVSTAHAQQAETVQSDAAQQQDGDPVTELVDGNSEFAFDLYAALRENEGNLFYSPYSISTAFGMVYAGAGGNTEQQIADTMHFTLPQEELHPAFNALNQTLSSSTVTEDDVPFTLTVANSLWPQVDYAFQQSFMDTMSENYADSLQEVDYSTEATREEARLSINEWISDNTAGKFEELLKPGILKPETRLAIVNAIYFNAEWVKEFDEASARSFVRLDESTVTVPMMSKRDDLGYTNGKDYQAVALPYKGERGQMIVILPDEGQFAEVEERLSTEFLQQMLEQLRVQDMFINFPKFDFEADIDLRRLLPEMCMTDAFLEGAADFTRMTQEEPLVLTDALHKASITVNERGTEAVGVTVVMPGVTSVPELYMAIDRPFIFLIHDKQTGSVLFMGRISDPTAAGAPIDSKDPSTIDCSKGFQRASSRQVSVFVPIVDSYISR